MQKKKELEKFLSINTGAAIQLRQMQQEPRSSRQCRRRGATTAATTSSSSRPPSPWRSTTSRERAGGVGGRLGVRRRRRRRRHGRVGPEDLHREEHPVHLVDGDGAGGVDAAADLGVGPHRPDMDGAHVVGDVDRVLAAGERGHRAGRAAQPVELGEGVVPRQRVVQRQRLELVGGEVRRRRPRQRRERRVLGDEHRDPVLAAVRLALERPEHVRLLQEVEERVERTRHAQEVGEVHGRGAAGDGAGDGGGSRPRRAGPCASARTPVRWRSSRAGWSPSWLLWIPSSSKSLMSRKNSEVKHSALNFFCHAFLEHKSVTAE